MEERGNRPVLGEFYRHFKGNLYQVKMLAKDSEDGTEMVVYQAMYPPFTCYVRKLSEFTSEVDAEKYPDVLQKMRFEQVTPEDMAGQAYVQNPVSGRAPSSGNAAYADGSRRSKKGDASPVVQSLPEMSDEELENVLRNGNIEKYIHTRISEKDLRRRGLLMLLDADDYHAKRQIFMGLRGYLDQVALNNIAVAFDLVLEDGDPDSQYDSILKCLGAFEHYEGGRLR